MKSLLDFWMHIWLYVMAIGGAVLIGLLVVLWPEMDWPIRMVYFTVIILVFHVWEEWRFPAGFHCAFNLMRKSDLLDRFPMNQMSDMITNFGALIVGFGLIMIGANPIVVLGLMYFCIAEVISHTLIGIRVYKALKDKGKKTIYNPGSATTYFMFLPAAVGFIYLLAIGVVQPALIDWLWAAIAGLAAILLLIVLPEWLFANKKTAWPFTGKYQYGYFKKFVEQ